MEHWHWFWSYNPPYSAREIVGFATTLLFYITLRHLR